MIINKKYWKVGEIATMTGLTVRTLRYYDQIGLFSPSHYTESGHRLYQETDLKILQQVLSLKQLGFSLDEIKEFMSNPSFDPEEVIRIQLEHINEEMRILQELRSQLENLSIALKYKQNVSSEQFIKLLEVMKLNNNKYFTQEQLDGLKQRGEQISSEKKQEVAMEWPALIAETRKKMEAGIPANNPEILLLAKRWKAMFDLFSGGNAEFINSAQKFHSENPGNELQFGMDGQLYQYIHKAMSLI